MTETMEKTKPTAENLIERLVESLEYSTTRPRSPVVAYLLSEAKEFLKESGTSSSD